MFEDNVAVFNDVLVCLVESFSDSFNIQVVVAPVKEGIMAYNVDFAKVDVDMNVFTTSLGIFFQSIYNVINLSI
jgi:hypothetical protein